MYGPLSSPIPGHTVSPNGCRACGMRGLGQDEGDPSLDPTFIMGSGDGQPPGAVLDPIYDVPLPPISTTPISSDYPQTIGTEFQLVGPNEYVNLQTGQIVPMSIAQGITAATTGGATTNVSLTSSEPTLTLTDPTSGQSMTLPVSNLTAAAQALQTAGQLVTAAGKLTAQGQALLRAGNLYTSASGVPSGMNLSAAVSSLTSWFTGSTLIAGVPNWGVLAGGIVGLTVLTAMLGSRPKRRRR